MSDYTRSAYDKFAPVYDDFNHQNDYEMWTGIMLSELEQHGLHQGRLLDVGCGTGRAFASMLRRGWEVHGCDQSQRMLAEARRKFGEAVALDVADACQLPVFGEFELVWALNDVVNYLTADGELEQALAGMRANLAPDGLLLFDANTIGLFESSFATGSEGMDRGRWTWSGQADEVKPGGVFEAQVTGEGVETHMHRQRHFESERIVAAMESTRLEVVATLGQRETEGQILFASPPDEIRDYKIVYVGRRVNGS